MRTVLVFVIGALVGAGTLHLVYFAAGPERGPSARGAAGTPGPGVRVRGERAPAVAERLEIYERAAEADAAELVRRIEAMAREPASATRRFTLDVLLTRLAELDPARAVTLAREYALAAELLVPLFGPLARADLDAALDSLAALDEPGTTEEAAMIVLDAAGYDELERIAAALPASARSAFRVVALSELAATAPEDALDAALALRDDSVRLRALVRIASVWAAADPHAALARAETLPDMRERTAFRGSALDGWSEHDAPAALRYAATRSDELGPGAVLRLRGLATDPRDMLDALEGLDGDTARIARRSALSQLAQHDPEAALRYTEAMPDSRQRRELVATIAQAYGSADPDAALAWVRGVQPADRQLEAAVLAGIALNDLTRAVDLALETDAGEPMSMVSRVVLSAGTASSAEYGRVAEMLLARTQSTATQRALQMLASRWSTTDPEGALEWLARNAAAMPANAFRNTAYSLAQREPELGARYVDRVPAEHRADWIASVVSGFASSDPRRAVAWAERFRGDPAYANGLAAAVQGLAPVDAPEAARLLERLGTAPELARAATATIASSWTQRDAYAAAQWADGLADPDLRATAVQAVARQWAGTDPQSARGWVLSLPRGAERDRVLQTMISAVANVRVPDQQLLDGFSSERVRQQAVVNMIPTVLFGQGEAAARTLIDAHVTDARLREAAERMLEMRVPGGIGGFSVSDTISTAPFGGPVRVNRSGTVIERGAR